MRHYPSDEMHRLKSAHVGQEYRIRVMQPIQSRGDVARYPVLYLADGNLLFEMCKGLSILLQSSDRHVSPFILVGIGYPNDSPQAGAILRSRDFTFPGYPDLLPASPAIEGVLQFTEGSKVRYGAEQFQLFLEEELIPFTERTFNADPSERAYFGHSAAGGFGLFTLFTNPGLFNRYIISSPGLSYSGAGKNGHIYEDYRFAINMVANARQERQERQERPKVSLFMSVGELEDCDPGLAAWQLRSSFDPFIEALSSIEFPWLNLMTEVFDNEDHTTVIPRSFVRGVQAIYRKSLSSGDTR